jgi:hypothetical protein
MLNKKTIVLFFSICIVVCRTNSQVNLQSGSATFSIPVFNWQDDKSRLKSIIALSYNSGNGLKVNELASNVGQGWSLFAGGVITRLQVGEPDDQPAYSGTSELDQNRYPAGYLYASIPASNGCPVSLTKYPIYKSINQIYVPRNETAEDKQLDYFAFQFNGKGGLFVLDGNGDKGVSLGDSKMKITFQRDLSLLSSGKRTVITSFTIQDVDGLKYKFEAKGFTKIMRTNYSDEYGTYPKTQPKKFESGGKYYQAAFDNVTYNPWVTSSWYLTEIEDVLTHRKVLFTYVTRNVTMNAGQDIAWYHGDKDYCIVTYRKTIAQTPEISAITYPDSHGVAFTYSSTPRIDLNGEYALSSIDITYESRSLSKHILNTTYVIKNSYGNPSTDYEKRMARLYLRSVQKIGIDLKEDSPPYIFDYYLGSSVSDDNVPEPFSYAKDIWGFYNGNNSQEHGGNSINLNKTVASLTYGELAGLCYLRLTGGPNYYNAKPGYAKNGLLRQIIYPTGGTLTYEYEQNKGVIDGITRNAAGVHVSKTLSTPTSMFFLIQRCLRSGVLRCPKLS